MRSAASGSSRTLLLDGWSVCGAPPAGAVVEDIAQALRGLAPEAWQAIPQAATVAAGLRAVNAWSLDAPGPSLDAQDWWFRSHFDVAELNAHEHVLVFEGLATLCEVWLNGVLILRSDNMFVAHRIPVQNQLRASGNELVLRCAALEQALAQKRPRPRWRVPMLEQQQLRWLRTTLLGRTPGWSPPAPPVGPWRPIALERRALVELQDLQLQTKLVRLASAGSPAVGELRCHVRLMPNATVGLRRVTLHLGRGGVLASTELLVDPRQDGAYSCTWRLDGVEPWWPHTHGEPALYQVRLAVETEQGICDSELGRIGFRDLRVDTRDGDFRLSVNGVDVFCRGACWTPLDPVSLQADAQAYAQAMAQVREAGMNMLRVCGPMVYEEDAFYDACAEQGVLLWQDMMFANMDYPVGDEGFMASITQEAQQQLSRWQSNPAVAVICGNSEGEQQAAMWGASRAIWSSSWFDEQLPHLCARIVPQAVYWPSSAHGGAFPHQADEGTTSYYGVGAYRRDLSDARLSNLRFATECLGLSNVPYAAALARMPGGPELTPHDEVWRQRSSHDLTATWTFDDIRDHYLSTLFGVDAQALSRADPARYLSLSRITSGELMAQTFAQWRRAGSVCRGALVWFLRDLWAGAGWGLLDERSQAKPCWHFLKRVLQPLCVLLTDEGNNGLMAHLINERGHDQAAVLEMSIWREGSIQIERVQREVRLPAHSTQVLPLAGLLDYFFDLTYAYRFGPLGHDLVHVSLHSRAADEHAAALLSEAFYFPGGMTLPMQSDLGLTARWTHDRDTNCAQVHLSTQRLAQFVQIDAPGYEPEDDYFHLAPHAERTVILRPRLSMGEPVPLNGQVRALNLRQD